MKILKKITLINISFLLIFNFVNSQEIDKIMISINNSPITTIDFENRIQYLEILNNVKIDINDNEFKEDFISVLLFNEHFKKNNFKTEDKKYLIM